MKDPFHPGKTPGQLLQLYCLMGVAKNQSMLHECFIHSELALLGRMSSFLQEEIKRQAFLRHLHGDLFLFHTE